MQAEHFHYSEDDGVATIRLAVVRYSRGLEFEALDGKPIYLAFGVVGPPQGTGLHVKPRWCSAHQRTK